jgi:small GTP-binding protein
MPTNVTYEYGKALKQFDQAKTTDEKISAIEEMIRACPKHKGTEKMLAGLKVRLGKFQDKKEAEAKKSGGGTSFNVKKEGAAQVVIVGPPNVGKSSLLNSLTNANAEVGDFAFTTLKPEVGMIDYGGAKVQLVEVPGIIEGASMGKGLGKRFLGAIRNADALVLLVDSASAESQLKVILSELGVVGIRPNKKKPRIKIEKRDRGGLELQGAENVGVPKDDLLKLLREAGLFNARVDILDRMTLDEFVDTLSDSVVYRPAIVAINKCDSISPNVTELEKKYRGFRFIPVSVSKGMNLNTLKDRIFDIAGVIRVYTKPVDGEADMSRPLAIRAGSTVLDIARTIHKDFYKNLKFARVWGSTKYPGQRVIKEYVLKDKDIIELHL